MRSMHHKVSATLVAAHAVVCSPAARKFVLYLWASSAHSTAAVARACTSTPTHCDTRLQGGEQWRW